MSITRHVKVQGNRNPYDGDWGYCGARDKADTPVSLLDWPDCSKRNTAFQERAPDHGTCAIIRRSLPEPLTHNASNAWIEPDRAIIAPLCDVR